MSAKRKIKEKIEAEESVSRGELTPRGVFASAAVAVVFRCPLHLSLYSCEYSKDWLLKIPRF